MVTPLLNESGQHEARSQPIPNPQSLVPTCDTRTVTPLRRLVGYALRYRREFVLGLVCVVFTRAVTLTSPIVLRHAVDDLTGGVTRWKLFGYGALLLTIGLVAGVFQFLQRR